jgi:hypothetical protein
MRRVIALLLWLAPVLPASAQDAGAPTPILRASIEPSRVVVGQPVTLHIDVLVPNYLTTPPVFPDFQLRNAVTRPLATINMSEQHAGVTYAGMRRDFAIHPQEPGAYALADQAIVVTYAADPPRTQTVTVTLPRLSFEAFIPDAAAAIDPFVAATRFTLRQSIEGASPDMKVGDAVIRTVTIEAQGIPSMLLPPVSLAAPAGIAVYPDQPSLQDRSDSRTDVLTATRIDRATFMLQQPGDYVLPGIEIAWWNLGDQTIQRARADAVTVHVAPNPALAPSAGSTEAAKTSRWRTAIASLAAHWRLVALATGGLLVLGWLFWRATPALAERLRSRREAYRRSEAAAFAHLRKTARRADPAATYFALRAWLERFAPAAPTHTVQALAAATQDTALDRELARLDARLFAAPTISKTPWSARPLLRRVAAARRKLLHPRVTTASSAALPAINPGDLPAPAHARRPVAR